MEIVIFQVIILLFSVVIHEVSHGVVAERLGDPTARLAGRLTLNPLKHLDPFGSVILPLLLSLIPGGIIFGWAKPVPYNPYNLKNPEKGGAIIAATGPLSNVFIATVFGTLSRFIPLDAARKLLLVQAAPLGRIDVIANSLEAMFFLCMIIVFINILLAIFNLVPIPPLDGSKLLFAILPRGAANFKMNLERYGFILVIIFIFFGFRLIQPLVFWFYQVLIGTSVAF